MRNLSIIVFINWLKNAGVDTAANELQRARIMLLNRLLLITLAVSSMVLLITCALQHWVIVAVNTMVLLLLVFPSFQLQKKGRSAFAQNYFLIGGTLAVFYLSIKASSEGRLIDVENILFAVGGAAVVLLEGRRLWLMYGMVSLCLLSLKAWKNQQIGSGDPENIIFLVINNGMALVALLTFTSVLRRVLYRLLRHLEESSNRLKKQKKKLEEQERIMRALIDNVPVFLAMVRTDGRYMVVNKTYSAAFQVDANKAHEYNMYDILPENILHQHAALFQKAFNGELVAFESAVELPSGEVSMGRGKYIPLYNEKGEVYAVSAFVVDITDLKEKEARLAELNQTKDRLFSIIAHDVRAPIGSLQNLLELWEQGMIEAEEMEEMAGQLKQNVSDLSFMLENLLHWARGQLDGFHIERRTVCLSKVVVEKAKLFERLAKEKGIDLQYDAPEKAMITADLNHCRLIIRNLLSNAIKFSDTRGKVELRVKEELEHCLLEIRDEGRGMTKEQVQQILSGEMRSSKGTEGEVGTGLGLVLVQEMVAHNKGAFGVESAPQKGSRFWVRLPKALVQTSS